MNPAQTARLAGRALLRNKMRSSLTALGIVIGVGAVIAMVAIGEGAKRIVEQTFEAMGTNLLVVLPGSSEHRGMQGGFGTQPTVTWQDLEAIQREVTGVASAAPLLRTSAVLQSEDQNWTTGIIGTTPEYFAIRSWPMQRGRAFDGADVDAGNKVIVLGQTVVDRLFGAGANPVGQQLRIKRIPFEVVGVLSKKGQSVIGMDYDDTALVPVSTFQSKLQGGLSNYIQGAVFISAKTAEDTFSVQAQVTSLLRDRHHLPESVDDDFAVRNLAEVASASETGTQVLTTLLAAIAAVSLLVGGIGVMNIMLVSVTERTREIGLRLAVGARPRDILFQFLVEALTLAAAGGAVGVTLGVLSAWQLSVLFHWPMVVQAPVIFTAVVFSGAVGLVFGMYPARKASRLNPIDALRYE